MLKKSENFKKILTFTIIIALLFGGLFSLIHQILDKLYRINRFQRVNIHRLRAEFAAIQMNVYQVYCVHISDALNPQAE